MKRKMICAILAVSTMCSNVLAATNVSMVDNKVTVEALIEAGKWGTLIVTKSGDSLDDENIIAMKQAKADENGKAVFKVSMPSTLEGGVNGKYDLHIKSSNGNIEIENMYYSIPADRNNVISGLKTQTDVKTVLENENNEMPLITVGVNLDGYNEIKAIDEQNQNTVQRDAVCEIFKAARDEATTDEELIELLNIAIAIQHINMSADKNENHIEKLGITFEGVEYQNADADTKAYVCNYIYANKPYESVESGKKAYVIANMLHVINNTRFDKMESKITGYAQGLGIAEEDIYKNYVKASNKSAINEDIVEVLKNKPAANVTELLSVIDTATKNNATQGGSSGGGGGGAGGGGGTIDNPPNPLASVPAANSGRNFKDIDDVVWAKEAISALGEKRIVAGDENGNFNPNNFVKREEFVKMLVVAADMHRPDIKSTFDDVKEDAWYSSYVASAYNSNLVYGISENSFGVGTNITRQDMAVMCYRAAKANMIGKVRDSIQFADSENISDYAKEAVNALYEAGVINGIGDNLFDPMGTATRAQAAVMIYNLFAK